MTDPGTKSSISNELKRSSINVFIKEKGKNRRGALPGNTSLLKSGDSGELVNFAGKNEISLIILSQMVPGQGAQKHEGLQVDFSDEMHLKKSEVRTHKKNTFEFIFYFSNTGSLKDVETHSDVNVQHPSSGSDT